MTVTVPTTERTGAAAIAAKITTLSAVPSTAPHYQQSQQLLNQAQIELVNTLLDQRKLIASSIISSISVSAARQKNPLYAAITAQNAVIASASAATLYAAQQTLDRMQRQLVSEELASGSNYTAAQVLSTMTYLGGAAS